MKTSYDGRFVQPIYRLFLIGFLIAAFSCVNDHLTDLSKKGESAPDTTAATAGTNSTATGSTSSTSPSTTVTTGSTSTPTTTVTPVLFSVDIKPLLIKYECANCHGNYFDSYASASSLAKSGQLYGTMSWSSGYRRMPPGEKPTATELTLISNWIKQGALNN